MKTRVVVMGVDMRKTFIGSTLVGLIEKSSDVKIMRAIIKILEEWMKGIRSDSSRRTCPEIFQTVRFFFLGKNPITLSQAPSMREKSILLVKLMQYVEKRFPDDSELQALFLELVNYVYRDRQLRSSELSAKLEPAFLAGLRCPQPTIRAKFFELFDESMRRRAYDRLMYISCSQNWDSMGPHYWIKQCIEILVATARPGDAAVLSNDSARIPSVCSVLSSATASERDTFELNSSFIELTPDIQIKEEQDDDIEDNAMKTQMTARKLLPQVVAKHCEFLTQLRGTTSEQFLLATAQLCHMDTQLAESVWLELFPRLWKILEPGQRSALAHEILPFVTSGAHTVQKDCHPSALNTFVEALSRYRNDVDIQGV